MIIQFLRDTPYTKRMNSKKFFRKGMQYHVDNEYGRELVSNGDAKEVVINKRGQAGRTKKMETKSKDINDGKV